MLLTSDNLPEGALIRQTAAETAVRSSTETSTRACKPRLVDIISVEMHFTKTSIPAEKFYKKIYRKIHILKQIF